ncbi:MAG: hypothetical protein A2X25_10465 [Chloroflexi bacterium GWB2_49_20]|nr:MAG: hypothetical protein A2X25_10465 [Chloroflexi bacterium GWB2_49_20]OGN79014.1 MAG: hypothetical protein A2X26_00895 [Chloroflexi bacterium GWC2_49_37]OGN86226.1 MAG: hypothetical protein A2X27_04890 [Chloroflexi bacterium GWD2_49_16]
MRQQKVYSILIVKHKIFRRLANKINRKKETMANKPIRKMATGVDLAQLFGVVAGNLAENRDSLIKADTIIRTMAITWLQYFNL